MIQVQLILILKSSIIPGPFFIILDFLDFSQRCGIKCLNEAIQF